MQSEFYAKPDPGKRKVDGAPLYVLDGERAARRAAHAHGVQRRAQRHGRRTRSPAKPGERVRLFVLNVGPSKTSSFHVVGTIFDRVWFEGNPDNQFRGMQTVLLGSSNSAIVEFVIPEAGSLHHGRPPLRQCVAGRDRPHLDRACKPKRAELEHHNIPATATPTDPAALKGKLDFESKCLACHSIGQGRSSGRTSPA